MSAYSDAVLADSPLFYLRLDETSGASCANSGSLGGTATCNGTYTRNVATAAASLGVGVQLGGATSDFISYPDTAALDITGDVTYECWVKVNAFTTYQTLIAKGIDVSSRGYQFRIDQTTRTLTVLKTNTVALFQSTTPYPNDGAWHHVAFTRSGNTYTIYVDGVSVGSGTNATAIDQNNAPLMVGAKPEGGSTSEPLNGSVDEPAVYNTALSGAKIADRYALGSSTPTVPPTSDFTYLAASLGSSTINFFDASAGAPQSWDWDFGDGSAHGTTKNPSHTYATQGTYTVTLIASNSVGTGTTRTRSVIVGLPTFVQRGTEVPAAGHAAVVSAAHVVLQRQADAVSAKTAPMAAWTFTRIVRQGATWQMVKTVRPTLRPVAWLPYYLPTSRGVPPVVPIGAQPWYWFLTGAGGSTSTGPQAGGISVY